MRGLSTLAGILQRIKETVQSLILQMGKQAQ